MKNLFTQRSGKNRLDVRPLHPGAVAIDADDDIVNVFNLLFDVGPQGGIELFFSLTQLLEGEKVMGAVAVGQLDQRGKIVRLGR